MGWFPVASLRFWTFFSAFFGLTGVVIDAGSLAGQWVGLGVAGAVGYVCGTTITRLIRKLRRERVDSSLAADDCVGETARVILPVGNDQVGKVRLELKGRTIELLAETEDEGLELSPGQACVIYGLKEDGRAVVTRAAALTD
jgi:membrane protein implicated in regulation of membrane protease activity